MKFIDFIQRDAIVTNLESSTKEDAVREMVKALSEADGVPASEVENIVAAILRREELGTTGIGKSIAIPHTKAMCVRKLVGVVALAPKGVEFDAIDDEVVKLFFLIVSPPDTPGVHLRALEHVTCNLKKGSFAADLMAAGSVDEVLDILGAADSQSDESSC